MGYSIRVGGQGKTNKLTKGSSLENMRMVPFPTCSSAKLQHISVWDHEDTITGRTFYQDLKSWVTTLGMRTNRIKRGLYRPIYNETTGSWVTKIRWFLSFKCVRIADQKTNTLSAWKRPLHASFSCSLFWKPKGCSSGTEGEDHIVSVPIPVSYTHLDVYKRQ